MNRLPQMWNIALYFYLSSLRRAVNSTLGRMCLGRALERSYYPYQWYMLLKVPHLKK